MKKVGILGGGQLGRMLLQAAANYPVETHVLENDESCPAAHLCHHFTKGNITNYEDVLTFGKKVDIITIEIENVNIEALEILEKEGKTIIPKPSVLKTIRNKIAQKQYYQQQEIPTADFIITNATAEIPVSFLPAVHKIAEGGYDGKGVVIMNTGDDITNGFDEPKLLPLLLTAKWCCIHLWKWFLIPI
jgi:5-(carboxyamino)imidazole ribonucleotide synthase